MQRLTPGPGQNVPGRHIRLYFLFRFRQNQSFGINYHSMLYVIYDQQLLTALGEGR